jgi:hypothetical protein
MKGNKRGGDSRINVRKNNSVTLQITRNLYVKYVVRRLASIVTIVLEMKYPGPEVTRV